MGRRSTGRLAATGFLRVIALALLLSPLPGVAAEQVRVGLLQFGTVNWEMAVVKQRGLDKQQGIDLKIVPLSSKNGVSVALQGGAVDVIVSDWIWVNRQRAVGRGYTFFPYSLAVGGLWVRPDAGIKTLADLRGRKLGIAGGPVDKSWLLLQAYGRTHGLDAAHDLQPVFAAPPLLNHMMLTGDLPAVLDFWHFGARLQAAGMRPLLDVKTMLAGLGVKDPVPMIGWVFSESWAKAHPAAIRGLLKASYEAKAILAKDDAQWQRLMALTKARNPHTLALLRDGYRSGIPYGLTHNGAPVAARVFGLLAKEGGERLVGKADKLLPGTFWSGLDSARLLAPHAAR